MSEEISMRKLYLVVFLTGAIVMVLELIGSRILAPTLGTSTFVWASIIGVILGAMSLGYFYGGKIADSRPNLKTFSSIIFLSGVFVFFIIIVKDQILNISPFLGVRLGSVFASVFLFAIPSFLLGMVSPYAVRLSMENVESSGRTVGNLYAVSTFGSIIGTFSAGFYLIPAFGSINILYVIAISLFVISLFSNGWRKKQVTEVVLASFVLGAFSWTAEATNGKKFLFETDSAYNHIRVSDTEKDGRAIRVMSVEDFFDSGMYIDSDELVFEYTKYYALDEVFGGKIDRAVMFGGAAYSVPKDFLRRNSEGVIDVVEIDPKTTEIARKYFNLEDDERMNIIHQDARIFLNEFEEKGKGEYDAIYNDAFSSACAMPAHLTTVEALRKAYNLLDENGVYISNIISSISGNKSTFFRAEYKTISEVFDGVYVFSTQPSSYGSEGVQNLIIVATKNSEDINKIIVDFKEKNDDEKIDALLENYWQEDIKTDDVEVLTDDFAPVDYYASAVCSTR
ncbi:MAG: fused MFS/spermidine synthase [Candidatus Paceibacterota bacterium]